MERLLACKCNGKGCDHWEVVLDDHINPSRNGAVGADLRCKTCGTTVLIDVEPHQGLIITTRD